MSQENLPDITTKHTNKEFNREGEEGARHPCVNVRNILTPRLVRIIILQFHEL
jgi:hypothetical protein